MQSNISYFCKMEKIKFRSDCPISMILDLIGDKWTMLVIRDIALFQKHTFNEFLKSDEKIASNILSDRIAKLEQLGFIVKKEHGDSKAKIYYGLTKKGIDLLPIIFEMAIWSDKHLKVHTDAKPFIKSIKEDRVTVLKRIAKTHQSDLK